MNVSPGNSTSLYRDRLGARSRRKYRIDPNFLRTADERGGALSRARDFDAAVEALCIGVASRGGAESGGSRRFRGRPPRDRKAIP